MSKLATELLKLSPKELEQKVTQLRAELVQQRRARANNELMNAQAIKKTRRTIAVALTLINQPASEASDKADNKGVK